MSQRTKNIAYGAILAALYTVLTHLQNLILPGSATWAVQLRLSEALCVLACFTPAAAPGLGVGCLLFNLSFGGALPLDFLLGPLATFLAARGMWRTRKWKLLDLPVTLLLPALTNGLLVGWELTVYAGGGFWMNAGLVALGEGLVLTVFGTGLYLALARRGLGSRIFG